MKTQLHECIREYPNKIHQGQYVKDQVRNVMLLDTHSAAASKYTWVSDTLTHQMSDGWQDKLASAGGSETGSTEEKFSKKAEKNPPSSFSSFLLQNKQALLLSSLAASMELETSTTTSSSMRKPGSSHPA